MLPALRAARIAMFVVGFMAHEGYKLAHMSANIRVVLIETSHPGNIGAVARAMKNMCLDELVLVSPKDFPSNEAVARASGAQDVLEHACVVDSLQAAVADCHVVMGTSARQRSTIWQVYNPRDAAQMLSTQAQQGSVALVFGRESTGLTQAELDRCTHLVHIPANPEYASLNIAMAVQVLSYELRVQQLQQIVPKLTETACEPAASIGQMEGFFGHLEQTLFDVGFLQAGREGKILQRLRRLFHRASPSEREVHILRGILSALKKGNH
jgi:tRNA (cytidine32/uridine32-2'-O)-methyltransferase